MKCPQRLLLLGKHPREAQQCEDLLSTDEVQGGRLPRELLVFCGVHLVGQPFLKVQVVQRWFPGLEGEPIEAWCELNRPCLPDFQL